MDAARRCAGSHAVRKVASCRTTGGVLIKSDGEHVMDAEPMRSENSSASAESLEVVRGRTARGLGRILWDLRLRIRCNQSADSRGWYAAAVTGMLAI